MPATTAGSASQQQPAHDVSAVASTSNGSSAARPRASSSVCVRPQLLNSRLRSRSLLKTASSSSDTGKMDSSSSGSSAGMAMMTSTASDAATIPDSTPSSPRFGATLLPRLAAVFGSSSSNHSSSSGAGQSSKEHHHSAAYTTTPSISYSFSSSSHPTSFSPDGASLSDSGGSSSSMLTYSGEDGGISSSTMPSTPVSSSVEDSILFNKVNSSSISNTASLKKTKSSGSPIANLPFLPRRRTLSNLFSQITSSSSSGKDKDKDSQASASSSIPSSSSSPTYNSLQLLKKDSSSTSSSTPSNKASSSRHTATSETHMHVPPHGYSTSTSAIATPPASTSSYSNPFASAFSYGGDPSSSSSVIGPRPSSPRLKKKDSYLALNIPPTPGAGAPTPSLAYTENGNRPLRGEDEDLVLPSPITEADEQEHPTHPHHRHQYHSTTEESLISDLASTSPSSSNRYSHIAAQSIPTSATSFLESLTSTAPTLSTQRAKHQTLSKLLPPILFLIITFMISLIIIFYMVSTIPLKIPHNISEIKLQTIALRDYSRKGLSEGLHVSAVLSALFVFKQAFSVPGSILVNILFGSLYGTVSFLPSYSLHVKTSEREKC